MSIVLNRNARVLVQGITGHQGMFHTRRMLEYGTNVVAGVTPGKAGTAVEGVEVFNSVSDSMRKKPTASVIFVPAPFAKDAALESLENGIKTVVIITEHIPVHDSMEIVLYGKLKNATIIGPNTPGIILPKEKLKLGIMPNEIFTPGSVGIISRSGTLTYEVVSAITDAGLGESVCIGLGGDQITGLNFIDVLRMLENDRDTEQVVMLGEIGGSAEEDACEYIREIKKPVCAYIAGVTAPKGKRMGHAGAIIARGKGSAESKIRSLESVGVKVAKTPWDIPDLLSKKSKY